ncbi:MAG: L-2-hydroxyglutarate oxidase [Planctomycetota bacterium]|nr:MAG: L-2-hydroxyglutarate oxidase [Planctomycetota bacterium]
MAPSHSDNGRGSRADVAIVGGGIIGMATAYSITQRFPDLRLTILEKEPRLGAHQTSHNSGVLHSGIYYRPGSLRATNCREGNRRMVEFCEREGIPCDVCGKVIVAVEESELPRLENIFERGQANGVRCEMIGPERLKELEPHAAGMRAIHVPDAGIVDYAGVCNRLGRLVQEAGANIVLSAKLTALERRPNGLVLRTTAGEFESERLITCAGLHADRVTATTGQKPAAQIVPFRGEYFRLRPEAEHLCRNLIYPVPDPRFPFLGVHFTRVVTGGVECGPNAVLAFSREGYKKTSFNPRDLAGSLTHTGFLKLAAKYWRTGLGEIHRSMSKAAFVKALGRLIPEIRADHLDPAPAGVRAQALGTNGELLDEFVIQESDRIINVLNAPSPAATASLNIGRLITDKLALQLDSTPAQSTS